ncbi:hypothetical protein AMAG_06496 [Allomyces macrogynus ATCC 38327]|uniref:Uncharacterized protein n=1 Tax=Allomyces macrogynus (strain ATCC 38327) TaxID=578462 RepID=A0A0L0SGQ2_ALLM3|nr:hypothetical protein AMAG_06496 [Allomyces macrogynus ATCC 38327]|eukprot:KNE61693.1 hypothetical protein AMAG_06496 [Allomyces macrogynus ATCC 38327]
MLSSRSTHGRVARTVARRTLDAVQRPAVPTTAAAPVATLFMPPMGPRLRRAVPRLAETDAPASSRDYTQFSLRRFIDRAHRALVTDEAKDQELYTSLTQSFRAQLKASAPSLATQYSDSLATAVARLKLTDTRHLRLLELLHKAEMAPSTSLAPSVPASSSSGSAVDMGALASLAGFDEWTPHGIPDLEAALLRVPDAELADYVLAMEIASQLNSGPEATLRIFRLFTSRYPHWPTLIATDPHALDGKRTPIHALSPAITAIHELGEYGRAKSALAVYRDVAPYVRVFLDHGESLVTQRQRALRLYTTALHVLHQHNLWDEARAVYGDLFRTVLPDVTHAFSKANDGFGPVDHFDQAVLVAHWVATRNAAPALAAWHTGIQHASTASRTLGALWGLFAATGHARVAHVVLLRIPAASWRRPNLPVIRDARAAMANLLDGIDTTSPAAAAATVVPTFQSLHHLAANVHVPLGDRVWAAVFRVVREHLAPEDPADPAAFPVVAGSANCNGWWVPVTPGPPAPPRKSRPRKYFMNAAAATESASRLHALASAALAGGSPADARAPAKASSVQKQPTTYVRQVGNLYGMYLESIAKETEAGQAAPSAQVVHAVASCLEPAHTRAPAEVDAVIEERIRDPAEAARLMRILHTRRGARTEVEEGEEAPIISFASAMGNVKGNIV